MADAKMKKYEQFRGQPRLPKFAKPKRYDLWLKPDLDARVFSGTVDIDVDVISDTKYLVLNAATLTFDSTDKPVQFKSSSNKVLEPVEMEIFEDDEIIVLEFGEILPVECGVLSIVFQGTLNDMMKGFYRSVYEHNGKKKNMAVTHFEPADARRCFPCWDEPALKATFKITLEVPSEHVALSNMPVVREEVNGNTKAVYYQESPIMSTYLVAVVVALLDYVEDHTPDGIPVRVYSKVGSANLGKFALDVAVKALDLYKGYFSVPYSLPKLDMVAIPDFASGAMENYGLITFREIGLLYDDKHSATANKKMVVISVTHELAHQWFGNLVTMEWWTHLWLNEGFATWVSYLAADILFPEWQIWTQFLEESAKGLSLDSLTGSHAIEVEINHVNEMNEIFDSISYMKGASIIRMLQNYLGAECFQRGLASYIKRYAYSNAKTEDLWSVLQEESGEPINQIMNSWTKQKGYPVISVKFNEQKLLFEQSQFLLSGSPGDEQWIVPITLCCNSYDAHKSFLLQSKSDVLDIKDLLGDAVSKLSSWIKVNVDQTGFYRVKYDEILSDGLKHAIETKLLSAMDKYGILDDSHALSMACQQSLTSLLQLMSVLREEMDYTVLSNLISISHKVVRIATDATPELVEDIKLLFLNLFHYSAEKLGWDPKPGESDLDAMLRGQLLTALILFGHDATKNEAIRRFYIFLDDRDTYVLPSDLRRTAYVAIMLNVTELNRSGYDSLLRIYRETDLSEEKIRILGSLGVCRDPEIILEVLNFLLGPEVRSQDVIYGLSISIEGREIAWKWLQDHWDQICKTYGAGTLITLFVSSIVSPFSSYEKAREVETFFANNMKPYIVRTLKQSLERIQINARWVQSIQGEKNLADAVKELAQKKY